MNQRSRSKLKRRIANIFGAFGYIFCVLQWFWVVMLYLTVVELLVGALKPAAGEQAPQLPTFDISLPSQLELVIIGIVVIVMVGLTIYGLLKMPFAVAKTSHKAVDHTAEKSLLLVVKAQHKKDTKKLRVRLKARIIVTIKIVAILAAAILTAGSGLLVDLPIDYTIALVVGGALASLSVITFVLQYAIAGWLRVKITDIW